MAVEGAVEEAVEGALKGAEAGAGTGEGAGARAYPALPISWLCVKCLGLRSPTHPL